MEASEYLGLDVGHKRIGLARASSLAMLAEPLTTISAEGALEKLNQIIKERKVGVLVVGLPRGLNGNDTSQTAWVRDWVRQAKSQIELPFFWQDEALTSVIAEAERKAHKRAHDTDALAAAILLQDFLDAPESEHVSC